MSTSARFHGGNISDIVLVEGAEMQAVIGACIQGAVEVLRKVGAILSHDNSNPEQDVASAACFLWDFKG